MSTASIFFDTGLFEEYKSLVIRQEQVSRTTSAKSLPNLSQNQKEQ